MSPSGLVITRLVKDAPGALVAVRTVLAPTRRSFALVVVMLPLLLEVLLPEVPTTTSRGLVGAIPRYSAIRMSGKAAAGENVTVTVLLLAEAAAMLAA